MLDHIGVKLGESAALLCVEIKWHAVGSFIQSAATLCDECFLVEQEFVIFFGTKFLRLIVTTCCFHPGQQDQVSVDV